MHGPISISGNAFVCEEYNGETREKRIHFCTKHTVGECIWKIMHGLLYILYHWNVVCSRVFLHGSKKVVY